MKSRFNKLELVKTIAKWYSEDTLADTSDKYTPNATANTNFENCPWGFPKKTKSESCLATKRSAADQIANMKFDKPIKTYLEKPLPNYVADYQPTSWTKKLVKESNKMSEIDKHKVVEAPFETKQTDQNVSFGTSYNPASVSAKPNCAKQIAKMMIDDYNDKEEPITQDFACWTGCKDFEETPVADKISSFTYQPLDNANQSIKNKASHNISLLKPSSVEKETTFFVDGSTLTKEKDENFYFGFEDIEPFEVDTSADFSSGNQGKQKNQLKTRNSNIEPPWLYTASVNDIPVRVKDDIAKKPKFINLLQKELTQDSPRSSETMHREYIIPIKVIDDLHATKSAQNEFFHQEVIYIETKFDHYTETYL